MSIQQLPNFPIVSDGSGFSFTGWFYPVGTQNTSVVLFDLSGAGLARSSVYYNGSNTLSTYYNGGNVGNTAIGNVTPSISITPGQWHFFCYTVRCTNVSGTFMAKESLYIDANCMTNQFSTDSTTIYVPFTILSGTIGGKPSLVGSYFNGRMSEMRYYGRVLTNPEIQVLYNMQNYINYQKNISITNPSSIQGKYNSINGAIIQDGLGQYGASVQIDLSGTFSYMDVSRNPGFNGGTTRTLFNLYASSLVTDSTSLTVDQSGNVFLVDTTVLPNQTYTYAITPHIRDISNTSTTVTTFSGATTVTTPAIIIQPIFDISAGAQTSKTTGVFGSMIQVDISGGIYSILDISRNPPFSFDTSPQAPTISPGIYTSSTGVLDISATSVLNSPSSQYQAYLLNTILYKNSSNPTLGTPGLAFMDTTAVPGVTYAYSFTPAMVGSAPTKYKTPGSIQNTGSITTPQVTILPRYDISAGAIIGKTVGKYGASVQIDLSGSFTYVDISRNPQFSSTDLSPLTGTVNNNTYRVYDASASLTSTDNAYITNALTYTNASAPKVGVIGEAFVDNTTKPNQTYSYYITPYIKGTNGAITTTLSALNGLSTITTPPVTILPRYDISAGAIIGDSAGKYGASVQIDLSGSFTYVDISRNPQFSSTDLSQLTVTTYRVYDASASLTSTDNAYITNALTYTNSSIPTFGIMGEVFVDKTASPNQTYSYYITPYIKGTTGEITTVTTATGISSITTPPVTLQYAFFDPSFGMVLNANGASVQIDLSGNITGVDISRNPAFPTSLTSTGILEFTYASSLVAPVNNLAYLTKTLTYQNVSALAFIDNTLIQNSNYTYYVSPYIKSVFGITYQATTVLGAASSVSTSTVTSGLGTVNPAIVPTTGTVSNTVLSSSSIPGITIGSGGSSGTGSGAGAGTGTGGGTDSGTGTGSAGTVTSSILTGGSLDGTGISATGGTPVLPSPVAGAVSLASGAVSSLYTGTLPSTVTTYYVVAMSNAGSTTISQAVTILAPPVGFTGASGNISFYAWPSSAYDTGTTLTVTMGGTTLLSRFSFSGPNAPVSTLNLPFVNFPSGSTLVNFIIANANATSNSKICLSGLNVNYSFVQGSGTSVVDISNLALYYPLDSSSGTLLYNYASGNPITDASLCSGAVINTTGITSCIGLGDVSFNKTLGSYAQLGKWTCPQATNIGNGFTISGWFYSSGTQASNATLCSLSNSTNIISIFLNRNNMQLDFSCNGTNGTEYVSNNQLYSDTWNFFAMTCRYNGTNSTNIYYMNDVSMQTLVGAYPTSSPAYTRNYLGGLPASTIIPANSSGNLGAFNGHIDDFRVYSRVLSSDEILSLWVYGINSSNVYCGNIVDPTGLVMYYTFVQNASV